MSLFSIFDTQTLSSTSIYSRAKYLLDRNDGNSTLLASSLATYLAALEERNDAEAQHYYSILEAEILRKETQTAHFG